MAILPHLDGPLTRGALRSVPLGRRGRNPTAADEVAMDMVYMGLTLLCFSLFAGLIKLCERV
jgi:hypothetical protein